MWLLAFSKEDTPKTAIPQGNIFFFKHTSMKNTHTHKHTHTDGKPGRWTLNLKYTLLRGVYKKKKVYSTAHPECRCRHSSACSHPQSLHWCSLRWDLHQSKAAWHVSGRNTERPCSDSSAGCGEPCHRQQGLLSPRPSALLPVTQGEGCF